MPLMAQPQPQLSPEPAMIQRPAEIPAQASAVTEEPVQDLASSPQVNGEYFEKTEEKEKVAQDWSGLEWLPIPDEVKSEVFSDLNAMCEADVDPKEAAGAMRAKYGEIIDMVPDLAPIEKLLESIVVCPALTEMCLVHRKGFSFLRNVWGSIKPV
jgi:hypothetical protein